LTQPNDVHGGVSVSADTNEPPAHLPLELTGVQESRADATPIEADFTGTDCQLATFTGRVVLTKG
jgi:hypothetical protein